MNIVLSLNGINQIGVVNVSVTNMFAQDAPCMDQVEMSLR